MDIWKKPMDLIDDQLSEFINDSCEFSVPIIDKSVAHVYQ